MQNSVTCMVHILKIGMPDLMIVDPARVAALEIVLHVVVDEACVDYQNAECCCR